MNLVRLRQSQANVAEQFNCRGHVRRRRSHCQWSGTQPGSQPRSRWV